MKKYYYGKGDGNLGDDYEVFYPEGAGPEEEYETYLPYYDEVDGDYKYLPADDDDYAAPVARQGASGDAVRLMLEKIEELNSKVEGRAQGDYRIDELDREIRSLKEQLYRLRGKDDLKKQLDELKTELMQEKGRKEEYAAKKQPSAFEPRKEPAIDLDAERIIREIEKLNIGGYDKNLEGKLEAIVDKRVADAVKAASGELKETIRQYFEELREESGRLAESALSNSKQGSEALDGISKRLSEHEESVAQSLDEYKAKLSDALLKLSELSEKLEPKGVIDRDSLYAETILDALSDIKADLRNVIKESEDFKAAIKDIEEKIFQISDSGSKTDEELQLALSDFSQALSEQNEERLSSLEGKMNSLSNSFEAIAGELKRYISAEVESKFSQQNLEEFKKELSNALSLELKAEIELLRQDISILFAEMGSRINALKEQLSERGGPEVLEKLQERLDEFKEAVEERLSALGEKAGASGAEALARIEEKAAAVIEERIAEAVGAVLQNMENIKPQTESGIGEKIDELKALVKALSESRSLDYDLSRIYTELKKLSGSRDIFGENFEKVDGNLEQLKDELAEISKLDQEKREGK